MTAAVEFVDAALRYEGSEDRAAEARSRTGSSLAFYGASVGAVRGTVRDLLRRHPELDVDALAVLADELWSASVFERRLSAIVLLQSIVGGLDHLALTRVERFLRDADTVHLVDPLTRDVVAPLRDALPPETRAKADRVIARWATDAPNLRRAAGLLARADSTG